MISFDREELIFQKLQKNSIFSPLKRLPRITKEFDVVWIKQTFYENVQENSILVELNKFSRNEEKILFDCEWNQRVD